MVEEVVGFGGGSVGGVLCFVEFYCFAGGCE